MNKINKDNIGMTISQIINAGGYNTAFWDNWVHVIANPFEIYYNDEDDEGRGPIDGEVLERIEDNQLFFSGGGRLIKETRYETN